MVDQVEKDPNVEELLMEESDDDFEYEEVDLGGYVANICAFVCVF